jgi:hypothetical protein
VLLAALHLRRLFASLIIIKRPMFWTSLQRKIQALPVQRPRSREEGDDVRS